MTSKISAYKHRQNYENKITFFIFIIFFSINCPLRLCVKNSSLLDREQFFLQEGQIFSSGPFLLGLALCPPSPIHLLLQISDRTTS
jgi:hypothetical protein